MAQVLDAHRRHLGAHLARLEIRTMYQQLAERLVSMERTSAPVRARSSFVGGYTAATELEALPAAPQPLAPLHLSLRG